MMTNGMQAGEDATKALNELDKLEARVQVIERAALLPQAMRTLRVVFDALINPACGGEEYDNAKQAGSELLSKYEAGQK